MRHHFSENKWESLSGIWKGRKETSQPPLNYEDEEVKELMKEQFMIRYALKPECGKKYNLPLAWEQVRKRTVNQRRVGKKVLKYAMVAVFLVGVGFASFFYSLRNEEQRVVLQAEMIGPGKQMAELVLANGKRIVLDAENREEEIRELGVRIRNDSLTGRLSYQASPGEITVKERSYNTLKVPKGGEYSLELPDGSVVWLNAETTLRFPVKFAATRREVYLQGEAFFKVAKDPHVPFHVYVAGSDITVLGTSFNVSAYADDDHWAATLVEGVVRVQNGEQSICMKPSEQYKVNYRNGEAALKTVDTDIFTSWVDGKIYFKGYAFKEIVKKLERWYDFDMVYRDAEIKQMRFTGVINKHRPLKEILQYLEKTTNVGFSVQGNTVVAVKTKGAGSGK